MGLLFNGVNQGLNTSLSSLAQNVSQCTLMAWINIKSFPSVSGGIIQINVNSSVTSSRINLLLLSNGALRIGGRAADSMPSISSVDSTSVLSLNTWYHVVGMINYATATGYIYIDGVQSSTTGTLSFTASVTDNTSSYASNLGSDENNTQEFCNLIIEDARVYHRVLNSSEIQTIYACRGIDSIKQDLQCRWLLVSAEDEALGSFGPISIENVQNASSTSNSSSITLSSYTVPDGSNLVLVVATTAEDGSVSGSTASSVTFNGNSLSNIDSINTTTSNYVGVSLWSKTVNPGEVGNIVVTFGGKNRNKTVFACTLINAQNVVETSNISYNNSGTTTTGLTTNTDQDLVVTACANKDGNEMSVVGDGHTLDSTITAGGHAGAIGHIIVSPAASISGIGFTASPTPSGEALVIAAFKSVVNEEQLTELSNNEYVATAFNVPVYKTSNLVFRRPLSSQ
jgi:hypothetical protein